MFSRKVPSFDTWRTAWKVSKYGVFSGPHFPTFGLNTERYSVQMRENTDQKKLRIWTHSTQWRCSEYASDYRTKNLCKPFKDTHREKAPSNKTGTLTKSMNMDICVVGTSNQTFIRGSWTETKFSVSGKTVFCDRSILYWPFCLS